MTQRPNSPSPPWGRLTTGMWNMKNTFSRWREHGTRDWLLMYTTGGSGRFGHDRGEIITKRWDAVLLAPGVPHDYGLEATKLSWDFSWAHFIPRAEWLPLLQWPVERGIRRLHLAESGLGPKVLRRLTQAHHLNMSSLHHREFFAMNALEEVILWCSTANPETPQANIDPRMQRTMEHICQHLAKPLSMAGLAVLSGLSLSRFAHLFKQELGCTPHEFLTVQRLSRARQLLAQTDLAIADIASEVGFQSAFYFSLRFKAKTGMSPSLYRVKASGYDPLANETELNRRRNLPKTR